ncbi:MAG: hypothetical protein LN415_01425 [Candidatus Thermoplasmatota archaeon]|nr:hypothetical protein [Candidatus Thermoplasmatota archaeon]
MTRKKSGPIEPPRLTWSAFIAQVLEELGGEANLPAIYEHIEASRSAFIQKKVEQGLNWRMEVRATLSGEGDGRGQDVFRSVGRGWWRLRGVPISDRMVVKEIRKTLRMLGKVKDIELDRIELESHLNERNRESRDLRFVYRMKS